MPLAPKGAPLREDVARGEERIESDDEAPSGEREIDPDGRWD